MSEGDLVPEKTPDKVTTVPEAAVTRLREAYHAWQFGMKKWPPAVNETVELRRAIVMLLKSVRTWGPY